MTDDKKRIIPAVDECARLQQQVGIARYGYLAAEWRQGIEVHERLSQASAAKSYYSTLLGIIAAEGKIPSPYVPVPGPGDCTKSRDMGSVQG